jgi:hypothetical protein
MTPSIGTPFAPPKAAMPMLPILTAASSTNLLEFFDALNKVTDAKTLKGSCLY